MGEERRRHPLSVGCSGKARKELGDERGPGRYFLHSGGHIRLRVWNQRLHGHTSCHNMDSLLSGLHTSMHSRALR